MRRWLDTSKSVESTEREAPAPLWKPPRFNIHLQTQLTNANPIDIQYIGPLKFFV